MSFPGRCRVLPTLVPYSEDCDSWNSIEGGSSAVYALQPAHISNYNFAIYRWLGWQVSLFSAIDELHSG